MTTRKSKLRPGRTLLKDSERRWILQRLEEVVDFYRIQILKGEIPRSDLGYLSIFFRLASKKLSQKDLKEVSHAVRDLSAEIVLQKKDSSNTHILLNPWSNLLALKIWEEFGEPTSVGTNLSLRAPKTKDQALFIGFTGYGLAGSALGQVKAIRSCRRKLTKSLRIIEEHWGYHTPQSEKNPVFDLGLAHGDAGILAYASYMKIRPIADKLALSFCRLNSLLGNRSFPHFLSYRTLENLKNQNFRDYHHRIGWCYGDLSVGFSLLVYSKMPKAKYAKQALEVSNKILDRAYSTDTRSFSKLDPFFCHGRAGVLQIALRRHQLQQTPKTKKMLRQCLPLIRISKRKLFSFDESARVRPLLEGFLGYGLVLISLLDNDDLSWDRIFLLTGPHG